MLSVASWMMFQFSQVTVLRPEHYGSFAFIPFKVCSHVILTNFHFLGGATETAYAKANKYVLK
jgi:hypothetical protein